VALIGIIVKPSGSIVFSRVLVYTSCDVKRSLSNVVLGIFILHISNNILDDLEVTLIGSIKKWMPEQTPSFQVSKFVRV
jgi:hypothetical protein